MYTATWLKTDSLSKLKWQCLRSFHQLLGISVSEIQDVNEAVTYLVVIFGQFGRHTAVME